MIPFVKVQSIGNDFVLLREEDVPPGVKPEDLAISMCHRRFGIGSDGLLLVGGSGERLSMRMWNPDGTEDFCGNGLRCVAWHSVHRNRAPASLTIRHRGFDVACRVTSDGIVKTELGPASFLPDDVPHRRGGEIFDQPWELAGSTWRASALSTGSTHVVLFGERLPEGTQFAQESQSLENDPSFPDRTSVIWAVAAEPSRLRIRIWERGVGETLGCGTGSSAAAATHLRMVKQGGLVTVENPGGVVRVSAERWDAPLTVEGMAEDPFTGCYTHSGVPISR